MHRLRMGVYPSAASVQVQRMLRQLRFDLPCEPDIYPNETKPACERVTCYPILTAAQFARRSKDMKTTQMSG